MKPTQAVIPMAGDLHAALPLQQIATSDGRLARVAGLHLAELREAGIERVALIVAPAARRTFEALLPELGAGVELIEQPEPRGFGDAVLRAESWCGGRPFVLQVCDHLFLSAEARSCTRQLVEAYDAVGVPVCGVQPTHESELPRFGVIGGQRVRGAEGLYTIETVLEKPTPTIAEERCVVPGLRHGYYLGFFGLHLLTQAVFDSLRARAANLPASAKLGLSESLAEVARAQRVLAVEIHGRRIDLEDRFGLMRAQLALALNGPGRPEVLSLMLEEAAHAAGRA